MANGFKFGKSSLSRLESVDPRISEIMKESIKTSPYDFGIVQGKRSYEDQFSLWKKGRKWNESLGLESDPESWQPDKSAGNIVTKTMQSKHMTGRAVDIAWFNTEKFGFDWSDESKYKELGQHIKATSLKLGYGEDVTWGGDWESFKDYPHFEIVPKKKSIDPSGIAMEAMSKIDKPLGI